MIKTKKPYMQKFQK